MYLLKSAKLDTSSPLMNEFPNFRAKNLIIEMEGTAAAGQTVAHSHFGSLLITTQLPEIGQIWNQKFSDLVVENNMFGGVNRAESAVGAAFHFSYLVPLWLLPWDENALHIDKSWALTIELIGVDTSKISSGTVRVYAEGAAYPQNYIPYRFSSDHQITAGDTDTRLVHKNNMNKIFLYKNTATLTNIAAVVDEQSKINSNFKALESALNHKLNLETFVADYALLDMNPSNEKFERLADSVELRVTASGTGSYRQIVAGAFENSVTNRLKKNSIETLRMEALKGGAAALARGDKGNVQVLADTLDMTTQELLDAIRGVA